MASTTITNHRFRVGQRVNVVARGILSPPVGNYEVLRLLPHDGLTNHYRVKSLKDGHERVLRELDLATT